MAAVTVVVAVLAVAGWLSRTASRLHRMHLRVESTRSTLEAQLLRRSGAALELAAADDLDPASRLLLLDAAHHARTADASEAELAESELSQALRAVLGDSHQVARWRDDVRLGALVEELAQRCVKVELARRFHNDAVVTARALRSRRRVRWFGLAGHAAPLRTVDLDDGPPPALAAPRRT